MQAFDVPVGLGAAGADLALLGAGGKLGGEGAAPEPVAVVCEHAFQAPAGGGELGGDASGELGGLGDGRAAGRRGHQIAVGRSR